VTRLLPIVFGQQDYYQRLGTVDGTTIRSHGCYVTTFATLAKACGKDTDPVQLNSLFTMNKLYASGNLMYDNNLTKVFPDIVYQKTYEFTGNADITLLKELMSDPTNWVILKIKIPPPLLTHFVLCTGVNGTIQIADPMTKKVEDFAVRYGNPEQNILKYVVYKGTPVVPEQVDDSLRVERDINWNMARDVITYLGVEVTPDDKEGMVRRAREKVNSFTNQIVDLGLKLEESTKKLELEQRTVITLKEELSKVHKEDKDYVVDALEAQHEVKEKDDTIRKISDELDIQYPVAKDKNIVEEILQKISTLKHTQQVPQDSPPPKKEAVGKPKESLLSILVQLFLDTRR
jgi:hypothetical protein